MESKLYRCVFVMKHGLGIRTERFDGKSKELFFLCCLSDQNVTNFTATSRQYTYPEFCLLFWILQRRRFARTVKSSFLGKRIKILEQMPGGARILPAGAIS